MVNWTEKRKRVKWGIPGCLLNGVNLNRHFKSVHPNLNPAVDKRTAGSGFAPGEEFSCWCNGSLVNGQDVSSASHEDAVRAFQAAREPILVEVVRRAGAQRSKSDAQRDKNDAPAIASEAQENRRDTQEDINEPNCNGNLDNRPEGEVGWATTSTQTEDCTWLASSDLPPPFHIDTNVDDGYHDEHDADAQHFHVEEVVLQRTLVSELLGLTLYYPDGDEAGEETDVLVQNVEAGGIAEVDGRILPGDQIIQINGEEVYNKEQAERLLASQCDVTLMICRPAEENDEVCALEPVVEEDGSCVPNIHELQLDNRVEDHLSMEGNGDSTALDKLHTIRSEASTSSSALSGSSGNCSFTGHHQVDEELNTEGEMTLVREQMANIRKECESLAERQRGSRECEIEEHIYETIPEVTESDEPVYCHPYDPSLEESMPVESPARGGQCEVTRWVTTAARSGGSPWQTNGADEHQRGRDCKSSSVSCSNRKIVSTGTSPAAPQPVLANGGQSVERSSRVVPATRESSLQTCLGQEAYSTVACQHCQKCMRFPPPHHSSNKTSSSTKSKNLKNVMNNAHSSEKNRNYVTFLSHGTLYTNADNLEETMQRQQRQLYQQLLRRGPSRVTPSGQHPPPKHTPPFSATPPQQYHYVSSPSGSPRNHSLDSPASRGAGEELQYQYKVKIRSDGSRYIARRPMRKQMLKERAARITEERTGVTTDDDAMSELKLGRYWPRDEKKRQLEHAREKKLRLQQRLGQRMSSLPEEGPSEDQIFSRKMVGSNGFVDPGVQKRSSTSARRRNPGLEAAKHSRPPKAAAIMLSVTTV